MPNAAIDSLGYFNIFDIARSVVLSQSCQRSHYEFVIICIEIIQ